MTKRLSRVTLNSFNVAATDFQLQTSAAVSQAMEYHRTKIVGTDEVFKLQGDQTLLKGSSVVLSDNQIVVRVFTTKITFQP